MSATDSSHYCCCGLQEHSGTQMQYYTQQNCALDEKLASLSGLRKAFLQQYSCCSHASWYRAASERHRLRTKTRQCLTYIARSMAVAKIAGSMAATSFSQKDLDSTNTVCQSQTLEHFIVIARCAILYTYSVTQLGLNDATL